MTRQQSPPSVYARGKLPAMRSRWQGEAGVWVRRLGPRVWPGVPPMALLGLTANSMGASERYCEGFCALGLYQTPDGTWSRLRASGTVRELLARDAAAVEAFAGDIAGQTAIGLVDYHQGGETAARALPSELRPEPGTLWAVWVAVMAYVVGASRAVNTIQTYLGTEPPSRGRDALPTILCRRIAEGGSTQSAYPTLRAWQRLASGKALAVALGENTGWWDALPPELLEQPLTDTYNSNTPAGEAAIDGMSSRTRIALVIAGAALVGLAIDVWNVKTGRARW